MKFDEQKNKIELKQSKYLPPSEQTTILILNNL